MGVGVSVGLGVAIVQKVRLYAVESQVIGLVTKLRQDILLLVNSHSQEPEKNFN